MMPTAPAYRLWLLLLLLPLLQACSAMRLAYNNADTLLYWQLDSYLDFSATQAPRVRESLAQFQAWHRRSQLPRYADALQRLAPGLAQALSAEQACTALDQLRAVVEPPLLDPAQWSLLWLTHDLSPEQLRHLQRKQAINNEEWKADWRPEGSWEQQLEARFDKLLPQGERLYGRLDEPQRNALREALAQATSLDSRHSYELRLWRQRDLRQALQRIHAERLGPEPARALLLAHLERVLLFKGEPARAQRVGAMQREGCQVFARLHKATTPAQRQQAVETIKGWEADLRQLAAQG